MSPLAPNGKAKNVKSSLRRMNQKPVDGLKTAMSVFPSPVKSAGAGISVAVPKTVENTFESELRDNHHSLIPPFGRVMPTSVFPSPSKSNGDREVGNIVLAVV